jgi:hypothetical protein
MTEQNNENKETNVQDLDELSQQKIESDTELKNLFINFVGDRFNPPNNEVTVEMCVELFAQEFPEFLLLVAQENFLRGYAQCLRDMENSEEDEQQEQKIQ